eukprot:scaffold50595_cov63-Attheya_sp.AAC.1
MKYTCSHSLPIHLWAAVGYASPPDAGDDRHPPIGLTRAVGARPASVQKTKPTGCFGLQRHGAASSHCESIVTAKNIFNLLTDTSATY